MWGVSSQCFWVGDHIAKVFIGDPVVIIRWHHDQRFVILTDPVADRPNVVLIGVDTTDPTAAGGQISGKDLSEQQIAGVADTRRGAAFIDILPAQVLPMAHLAGPKDFHEAFSSGDALRIGGNRNRRYRNTVSTVLFSRPDEKQHDH